MFEGPTRRTCNLRELTAGQSWLSLLCLLCATSVHVGGCINGMCAFFYRDRVEGPQSIIKSQRHRVLGSDCSKNFMGRRGEKKEN